MSTEPSCKSLGLHDLLCKIPAREYTLLEAVDWISDMNQIPERAEFKKHLKRALTEDIHSGKLPTTQGVRYDKNYKYYEILSCATSLHIILKKDDLANWCQKKGFRFQTSSKPPADTSEQKEIHPKSKGCYQQLLRSMFKLIEMLIKQLPDHKHHYYKQHIRKGKLTAGGLASILDNKDLECPKSTEDLLRSSGL